MDVRIWDYAAGAAVSNAPVWILLCFLPYLRFLTPAIMGLTMCFVAMGGGTLAGFLVARRVATEHVKAGLNTGFFSYVLYAIFLTVIGIRGGFIVDMSPLTGFVIGGAVGARIWEIRVSTSQSTKSSH